MIAPRGSVLAPCALFLACVSALAAPPAPAAATTPAPFDTAFRRLMAPAGFRPVDFDLTVNYRAEIPRTLSAVEALLRRPRTVDSLVPALRASLEESASLSSRIWPWIDVAAPAPRAVASGKDEILVAEESLRLFTRPLSRGETAFLLREVPPLLVHGAEDTSLDPIESELSRLRGDALIDSVMRLAAKLPMERLAEAAQALDQARAKILASARHDGIDVTIERLKALRARGSTLFFSSHALADVDEICDRMAILHGGQLRFIGSPAECRSHYTSATLEQAYMACIGEVAPA